MYIFSDYKYHGYSNLKIFYSLFFHRGVSAVVIYRMANWLYKHKMKFFALLLYQFNYLLNSCEIAIGAEIGRGFRIAHPVGVVIGGVTAGENLTVYQNVTIGKNKKVSEDGRRSPILKDNVTLFSGSVVVGPIEVGSDVSVGANTVVVKDVPDGSRLIGAKAQSI